HQRDWRGLYDRLDEPGAGRFARRRVWTVRPRGWLVGGRGIRREHHNARPADAAGGGIGWRRTIPGGFDQRYINVNMLSNLPALGAPFVYAPFTVSNGLYQPQLQVSWATLSGISVS